MHRFLRPIDTNVMSLFSRMQNNHKALYRLFRSLVCMRHIGLIGRWIVLQLYLDSPKSKCFSYVVDFYLVLLIPVHLRGRRFIFWFFGLRGKECLPLPVIWADTWFVCSVSPSDRFPKHADELSTYPRLCLHVLWLCEQMRGLSLMEWTEKKALLATMRNTDYWWWDSANNKIMGRTDSQTHAMLFPYTYNDGLQKLVN